MFTPLNFVLYTVVQYIVGCILYNKQTLCFPFDYNTDCSIDFDWLQVHINKEQEDAGYSAVKIGGARRRKNKKNAKSKAEYNFWSILSYNNRTCFHSSKDNDRKIWNEIRNVLLPEKYMFWTTCFLFFGVLFTDCLIVYIILIALFMIWEQCLVLSTGKSVLRRKFHFARGVRGFVNSAWSWGFVFNVFRKWSKVSEIVF